MTPGVLAVFAVLAAVMGVVLWPSGAGAQPPGSLPRAAGDLTRRRSRQPVLLASARRWRVRRAGPELDELADLLEVMVPALRAGASVPAAVGLAGRAVGPDGPLGELVEALVRTADTGGGLAGVWAAAASSSGVPGLDFVSRAWALSEQTGVPLSVALTTAARSLRARRAAAQALAASTAGARASMTLLALLPAMGPAIGLLFGLTPLDLYGTSTASTLSLVAGALLGAAGWLWSRAILRRALRPETVGVG